MAQPWIVNPHGSRSSAAVLSSPRRKDCRPTQTQSLTPKRKGEKVRAQKSGPRLPRRRSQSRWIETVVIAIVGVKREEVGNHECGIDRAFPQRLFEGQTNLVCISPKKRVIVRWSRQCSLPLGNRQESRM